MYYFLFPLLVTLMFASSTYAVITITRTDWRSLEALVIGLYSFSMSVLLTMAIIAIVDAAWYILFHTSFLSHLRDGDLMQHLEAGWK